MKIATCKLESLSPYSQSRYHETEKLNKEQPDDYRKRTWREHLHYNKDGAVYIPPMTFKNCLSEAAKFLGVQIPGKGKSTYTKHFEAGVLVWTRAVSAFTRMTFCLKTCFCLPKVCANSNGIIGIPTATALKLMAS